jgi:DNA invertase Pin-like site-specific DNA recombinase
MAANGNNGGYVGYYRVSTQQQGQSGLGLAAQREAVRRCLGNGNGELLAEFTEVETGKGANALAKRPQLRAALDLCRKRKATLIIAKLDRLARNVHFVSGLIESGVEFIAADMPQANKVMIQMHAVMSEWERDQISARTKAALQAAKARGVKLGKAGAANLRPNIEQRQAAAKQFAENLRPVFEGLKGLSRRAMARRLNAMGLKTMRAGEWTHVQVGRALKSLNSSSPVVDALGQPASGDV